MARSGTLRVRIVGDSAPLEKTLKGVLGKAGKFAAATAAVGAAAAGAVVFKGVQAAREANEINRITANVIKTTGGAANVSAKQVEDLSGRLQKLTGVSDETIQRGSNMLLTFTKVRNEVGKGNDIFDQATGLALDMSTAMGTDVKDSAIQLGKALNDPIKGVSALSRVGVQFTDQQKDQIKTLMESGDQLGAQKIILKELETQFGGTAEAAADPMKKLMSTVDDIVEVVGQAFIPIVDKAATWLSDRLPGAVDAATAWITNNLVPAFESLKAWWDANGPAIIGAVRALWDGIRSAFDSIVGAVQTVIGWFQRNRDEVAGASGGLLERLQEIWGKIVGIFGPAIDAITAIISTGVSIITGFWERFGKHILAFARETFDNILRFISGILDAIKGVFDVFAGLFTGDWGRLWDGVKAIFSGVWDAIKALLGQAFDVIKTILGAGAALISQIWGELWERAKSILSGAWDAIVSTIGRKVAEAKAIFDSIVSFVAGLPGRIASVARGMWDSIWDGFRNMINNVIRGWNNLSFSIPAIDVPGPFNFEGATVGTPNLPYLERGGEVLKTGLAVVHRGERFSGTRGQYPIGSGGQAVNINLHMDGRVVARSQAFIDESGRVTARRGRLTAGA